MALQDSVQQSTRSLFEEKTRLEKARQIITNMRHRVVKPCGMNRSDAMNRSRFDMKVIDEAHNDRPTGQRDKDALWIDADTHTYIHFFVIVGLELCYIAAELHNDRPINHLASHQRATGVLQSLMPNAHALLRFM